MSSRGRYVRILLSAAALVVLSLTFGGCKAQQQMQQQIADMDAKLADAQRRITALDAELKKANFEITQMKGLVTKLGNVTVDLQKAEEERQKAAAEAKAKAEAAAAAKKAAPAKKPGAKPAPAKKPAGKKKK